MTGENLAALVGAFIGSCAGMIIGWFARDVMRSLRVVRRTVRALMAARAEPTPQLVGAKQIDDFSVKKPPLGLVPRYIRDEQRAREIIDAILRYIDNGRPVPHEWIDELAERTTVKEGEAK